jgi:hypothetical protein
MKLKTVSLIALLSLSFTAAVHANEVQLTANQKMTITYRLAHKNQNSQPIFGALQTRQINKDANIPVSLDNYNRAGIVIVSVNGHELPPFANQFDKAKQCSMTTDKINSTGKVEFNVSAHSINCKTSGGVFG